MGLAYRIRIKAMHFMISAVDTLVLAILMFLIAIDFYAAWDAKQAYEWAEAAHYEIYKPTEASQKHSFEDLKAINPEVFGWISVYGTKIDYPICQASDNLKYVNTNALGKYSLCGAIFLDARCSKSFEDYSSILYGHHMEKQAMFAEIGEFAHKGFFEDRKYGMLYFDGKEHGIEFFAFIQCDAYDSEVFKTRIADETEKEAYLDHLLTTAKHARSLAQKIDGNIVLLSTCSAVSTNSRDILVGRITDTIFEDAFKADDAVRQMPAVDALAGLLNKIPLWAKIVFVFLLLIALLLIAKRAQRKKRSAGMYEIFNKGEQRA